MKPLRMRKLDSQKPKEKEKERAGAGASWSPGAGAGGAPALPSGGLGTAEIGSKIASSLGTAAPGSSTSALSNLVGVFSKATGLSTVVATKAGVVALTLAAGTVAAGVSLIVGNSNPSSRPVLGHRVFDKNAPESGASTSASQPAAMNRGHAPADGSSSLDYLAQGNVRNEAEAEPGPEGAAPARDALKTAESQGWTKEVLAGGKKAEEAKAPPAPGEKPKMGPSKSKVSISGASSLQSAVTLKPMTDFSGGMAGGFQEVYKPPPSLMNRASYGANRRSAVAAPMAGSSAWDQAKFTAGMSRRGARMAAGAGSSANAGLPFDGGMSLGSTAKTPGGGGTGLGGTGLGGSASGALDSKSVSYEPPAPDDVKKTKNETPYQGLIYAGMAALMIGQILVGIAGKLASSQQYPAAKAVAAAAMAAGGSAAGLGGAISSQHGQITQGIPFIIGGGVVAAQAAMVLMKAQQAEQDAQSGVNDAAGTAQGQSDSALQAPQIPQMPSGNSGSGDDAPKEPAKQEPIRNDVNKTSDGDHYTGAIDIP